MFFLAVTVLPGTQTDIDSLDADSLSIATAEARRTGIVIAAQDVMPSVVSITVLQTQTYSYSSPLSWDPFVERFFGDLFPEYSREIQSLGSGLIVSADGMIITNYHVISDANKIKVTLSDGRTFDTRLAGVDEGLDLAVLQLLDPPDDLIVAKMGNSDDILIGEWAIALGNPFGFLLADTKPSVTAGVVSAVGRRVQTGEGKKFSYSGVIQTDAAINPGNSGGPLSNITGEVIGINTFIFTKSGGSEGIGFAIPINQVRKFMYELESHDQRRIAWLGLGVQTLTTDMARALNIEGQRGIIINQVYDDTPARRAGLEEAWVIARANGLNYTSEADWQMMEQGLFVGDTMKLEGLTDKGDYFTVTIPAVEYQPPRAEEIASLEIEVMNLDPAIRYRNNIISTEGVYIKSIAKGKKGSELGIKEGDVILAYDQEPTPNIAEFKKAVRKIDQPRVLLVERNGSAIRIMRGY